MARRSLPPLDAALTSLLLQPVKSDIVASVAMQLSARDSPSNPVALILGDPEGFLAKTNGAMLLTLFFSSM